MTVESTNHLDAGVKKTIQSDKGHDVHCQGQLKINF